jgi:hypothetical protein
MERGEKVPYLKKIFELEQYGYKFDKKYDLSDSIEELKYVVEKALIRENEQKMKMILSIIPFYLESNKKFSEIEKFQILDALNRQSDIHKPYNENNKQEMMDKNLLEKTILILSGISFETSKSNI